MRPFYCGSQYLDWVASNCERCKKGSIDEIEIRCPIQRTLDAACIGDGEISDAMAVRMGITEETKNAYGWPCAEVEWTEEWKAEYIRRKERCTA